MGYISIPVGRHRPPGTPKGTKAALHCLAGCAIGTVIGTALLWGNVPAMILAPGCSFTPFAVMELVDNAITALTPGALDAPPSDGLFRSALLGGLDVAFAVTTPVNKWMTGRGKGHAVAHAHH